MKFIQVLKSPGFETCRYYTVNPGQGQLLTPFILKRIAYQGFMTSRCVYLYIFKSETLQLHRISFSVLKSPIYVEAQGFCLFIHFQIFNSLKLHRIFFNWPIINRIALLHHNHLVNNSPSCQKYTLETPNHTINNGWS